MFRLELTRRSIPRVMAVKASTSAYPADASPNSPNALAPGAGPACPATDRTRPAWPNSQWPPVADRRMATRRQGTHRLLALRPARQDAGQDPCQAGKNPVAHRIRLPRTENRARPLPLRGTVLPGLPPPRHPRVCGPPVHHQETPCHPKSSRGSLSLYGVLKVLQRILIRQLARCPYCQHAPPT